MEYILAPYKDPTSGLNWVEQTPIIKNQIQNHFSEYGEKIEYEIIETDHGKGADWPTIALVLINVLFVIPTCHKKIRESISEWKLIYYNICGFTNWISEKFRILFYPRELLLLDALSELEKSLDVNDIELLSIDEHEKIFEGMLCPENLKLITFTFKQGDFVYQVGFSNDRKLMFVNKIKLVA